MTAARAIADLDWGRIASDLDAIGAAAMGRLLCEETCAELRAVFDLDHMFRKTIDMARHGFGSGRYRYFADPAPEIVAALRAGLYEKLAPLANAHADRLGVSADWPAAFSDLRDRCAAAGQTKPTPLLLRYGPGDYNRLHQDIYGAVAFPLQIVVQLSEPGADFEGGEFVVTETSPRRQSRATVFTPGLGEAVLFHTRESARQSARGWSKTQLRHGVSEVRRGHRYALGIIFHDAS